MTASISPWIASGMKENNKSLEGVVESVLSSIVNNTKNHIKFMNMLSMLEHMGSRKIMLSQMNNSLSEDTLRHLAEEARHAYFFKRQAERLAKTKIDGYDDENTLARASAIMYFGRLDAGITREVGNRFAYPWVSLVIELRACWTYEIYQKVLKGSGIPLSLKSLLAEEDLHLADMFKACGAEYDVLCKLSRYETNLFVNLWNVLDKQVSVSLAA